jgi:Glycosyltransferase family 87
MSARTWPSIARPLLCLPLAFAALALPGSASASSLPADPADQPPFGGGEAFRLEKPPSETEPPPGFSLGAGRVAAIAAEAVEGDLEDEGPIGEVRVRTRTGTDGEPQWQVDFFDAGGTDVAQVVVDDASGEVVEKWTGSAVETKLARGYEDAVSGDLNEWWFWLPLCLAFILPFVDPRRPLRLIHLDLVALLGFSVSLFFFNKGDIDLSVPLVYPVLAYVFIRMLVAGFRPSESRDRLLPLLPRQWLVAGIAALVALHAGWLIADGKVIDVGLAGVVGAERITDGEELYSEDFSEGLPSSGDVRGDTYGPVNYLAHVPFEQAFPWSGRWDDVPAARAAALGFDLLTALALFALGTRLRRREGSPSEEGRTLGLALAFAWLAYPFTLYTLGSSFNDSLVALLVVCCLLVVSSPPARGALAALGGLTKFGPLALAPLFAAGTGDRRPRPLLIFGIAFAAVAALVTVPLLPDGGFRELYDRSLGYQASRGSPFSVWGQAPSLDFLQTVTKVLAAGLAVALFFVPRNRSPVQLAALAAATLIAIQVASSHWFYPYAVWFAPLVLIAVFAAERGPETDSLSARRGRGA